MEKQLTVNIDEQVYNALTNLVAKDKISLFIEDLVRKYIQKPDVETAYKQMAEDTTRETEAQNWSEETFIDFSNETW